MITLKCPSENIDVISGKSIGTGWSRKDAQEAVLNAKIEAAQQAVRDAIEASYDYRCAGNSCVLRWAITLKNETAGTPFPDPQYKGVIDATASVEWHLDLICRPWSKEDELIARSHRKGGPRPE